MEEETDTKIKAKKAAKKSPKKGAKMEDKKTATFLGNLKPKAILHVRFPAPLGEIMGYGIQAGGDFAGRNPVYWEVKAKCEDKHCLKHASEHKYHKGFYSLHTVNPASVEIGDPFETPFQVLRY